MKIKNKIFALGFAILAVFGLFALSACSPDPEPSVPKHNITVQDNAECSVSVDKTQAEFAETVTVTLRLKTAEKYVAGVTYNGQAATQRTETTYDFLMGNDDVVVAVELKPYQQRLSDGNGFATYLTFNPSTLAKGNGTVNLTVSLNGSYMTILHWKIASTDQTVLPGASVKNAYTDLTETGAVSASVQTASASTVITALNIRVDTDKIQSGKTFLLVDLQNGNVSSQKASLVIPITVAEEILTAKWQETLLFDVSALPSKMQQGKFNVYVTDFDFVPGSDNQEQQEFIGLEVNEEGKVKAEIEYVSGRRYYVAFWVVNEDGSVTNYKLLDTTASGSSATGYNQVKNGMLTLLSDRMTFLLTVSATAA